MAGSQRSRSAADIISVFQALELATQEQRDQVLLQGRSSRMMDEAKAPRYRVRILETTGSVQTQRGDDAELEGHR